MKKLLLALALLLLPTAASAQCTGVFPANNICGTIAGGPPGPVPNSQLTGVPGGTNGQIQYNNSGAFGGFTASQDCTVNTSTGAVTCTKTNNVSFGNLATQSAPTGVASNCITANSSGVITGTGYPCLPHTRIVSGGNATITSADCSGTVSISGGFFNFVLPSSTSGYPEGCIIAFYNADTWGSGRGKPFTGGIGGALPLNLTPGQGILWPTRSAAIQVVNGVFVTYLPEGRSKLPSGTVNFYADFANGNDNVQVSDCLATTTGACKTVQIAMSLSCNEFDLNSLSQTIFTVNVAANNSDTSGVHYACHGEPGAQGGAALNIVCNTGATFNTTNTDAFAIEAKATVAIAGCIFQAGGTVTGIGTSRPADGLRADYGGIIFAGGNSFAVTSGSHYAADDDGLIQILGNDIVINSASTHYFAVNGGNINTGHLSIILTTTIQAGAAVTISSAWASAGPGGNINVPNELYPLGSGASVTGLKTLTTGTGSISVGTGTTACNNSYFPGNSNGSVSSPFCS